MNIDPTRFVADEDFFVSIVFKNDLTKKRLFYSLKDFLFNQKDYRGIKDYCIKNNLPSLQFSNFVNVCVEKNMILKQNDRYRFTDEFLEEVKNLSPEWAIYYSAISAKT